MAILRPARLWYRSLGMKRCILALACASVAALAQEQPQVPSPGPPLQFRFFGAKPEHRMFRWKFNRVLPLASTEPRMFVAPPEGGSSGPCVAPLLMMPIDPDVDPKMNRPAHRNIDKMPVAKGLPPCPNPGNAVKSEIPDNSNR